MTAIVGILNKRAVAVAADSALTVEADGKKKIYNNAQKIFSLGEDIPVGIMLAGKNEFMFTPWDLIIKMYAKTRKLLGYGEEETLDGYVTDFLNYIRTDKKFSSEECGRNYICAELSSFYYNVKDEAERICQKRRGGIEYEDAVKEALEDALHNFKETGKAEDMEDMTIEEFLPLTEYAFDSLKQAMKNEKFPVRNLSLWREVFYEYITSECFLENSEIVFTGYGSNELYPSIISITLSGIIGKRVRYRVEEEETTISDERAACIIPFAQDDVVITLLKGIAPALFGYIVDENQAALIQARNLMLAAAKGAGAGRKVMESIRNASIDKANEEFCDNALDYIGKNYSDGVLSAVDCFSVKEMASMAESLISVTGLQRHFSSSEESVGGPVNVAVITKTEGFQWVKTGGA